MKVECELFGRSVEIKRMASGDDWSAFEACGNGHEKIVASVNCFGSFSGAFTASVVFKDYMMHELYMFRDCATREEAAAKAVEMLGSLIALADAL